MHRVETIVKKMERDVGMTSNKIILLYKMGHRQCDVCTAQAITHVDIGNVIFRQSSP